MSASVPRRVSQLLDLRGSTFCVDAACASSMVAVHELLVTDLFLVFGGLNMLHDVLLCHGVAGLFTCCAEVGASLRLRPLRTT